MSDVTFLNPRPRLPEARYLGDAVYASFDGFQIWLHLNSHDSPRLIALEPEVFKALLRYRKDVYNHFGQEPPT